LYKKGSHKFCWWKLTPGRIFCFCSDERVLWRMNIRLPDDDDPILMFNGRLVNDISWSIFDSSEKQNVSFLKQKFQRPEKFFPYLATKFERLLISTFFSSGSNFEWDLALLFTEDLRLENTFVNHWWLYWWSFIMLFTRKESFKKWQNFQLQNVDTNETFDWMQDTSLIHYWLIDYFYMTLKWIISVI